ncbi:hypothetical protein HN018_18265 [Lichenicola cladoniae]|uniref:Uncharacterized protein n=1 Tax=Lichenicola cladoniae TaxID=1484109 RepID=A0A6M8HU72_9PROT|nr:hypothetical protein [Lichenicola cladoniae]NPD67797.1 hypothetical protein [Acetobacteraceae bacterium]QKE91717.1 hypothetical protein HN018_18265 [Lichenicola cladoniae]
MKCLLPGRLGLMAGLVAIGLASAAAAPDDPVDNQADAPASATSAPPGRALWCGVTDPFSNRYFVSDVAMGSGSAMHVSAYGSRFSRAVGRRLNKVLPSRASICRSAPDEHTASAARSAAIRAARAAHDEIVVVGVF